jgi:hypothetical protein
MGLITEEVQVRIHPKTLQHYLDLGYDIPKRKARGSTLQYKEYAYDTNNYMTVKAKDLSKGSHIPVMCSCDICNTVNEEPIMFESYLKNIKTNNGKYVCLKCSQPKKIDTMIQTFGSLEAAYEHGNKVREQTFLNKYGGTNAMYVPELKQNQLDAIYDKYGYYNVGQSPEIKDKIRNTLYENGTVPTSKQQKYLCNLYNGKLNYPIKYYSGDIVFPDEMVNIEYSGGGHWYSVIMGNETEESFKEKEIKRFYAIKQEGYKQIEIISRKDWLPLDEILLQMLQDSKQYFKDYPKHSWIQFDIDKSIYRNAEHQDGVHFDFKQLRKITDDDLQSA